jgi:hypothetical protein
VTMPLGGLAARRPSLRRYPVRRYVFLIVVSALVTVTVVSYWPKPDGPMVAVNDTAQLESVRLTLDTGGSLEYAMPPSSAVVLPRPPVGTVTGAVIFNQQCVGLAFYGWGPRVFAVGGDINARSGGDFGQHYDGATQPAVAGSNCVGVPVSSP